MYSVIKTVMMTHNPNWGDIQALLEYLFMYEERQTVLEKVREGLSGKNQRFESKDWGGTES